MCYYESVVKDTINQKGGVTVDKNKLDYEIKRNGYTKKEFCDKIGISVNSYYRKCKNDTFLLKEMKKIITTLNLENPMDIFFAKYVS